MISKLSHIATAILAFSVISIQPLIAEGTVDALIEKAEADLHIETEKLKMKYLIALEKLQKSLAADGDLDGAIAVKKESDRASDSKINLLSSSAGASGTDSNDDGGEKINLSAKDARLGNGTQYDKDKELVKGWSRYGAFAAWSLEDIKPGYYKVTLNYHSGNLGGGVLSLRTAKGNEKFSIAGAGQWDELRSHVIAKVYLSGPDHLTIAALQGRSREMVYVDSVVLEPAK